MRADDRRQRMKIEQGKKVDRAKLSIHCRRATDFCADGQVRAHELRRRHAQCRHKIDIYSERWMRHSSPLGPSEMLAPQLLIHRHAFHRILRCKRATSDEETRVSLARVTRDAAPEQMQQIEIAVLSMHACSAQLDHFAAQWFVGCEIKLALAVIADVRRSASAGLQSICANELICRDVFDDQVVANVVEK